MSIKFQCHNCHNEVTAPDAAAGKKGKCPFCGQSNEIPLPVAEDDMIPLAPIDEEAETRERAERHALFEREKDLLAETGGESPVPLEHRSDLGSEDLHHFVVNYCLDLFDSKLAQAEQSAEQLTRYGPLGAEAVDDLLTGKAMEPALDRIPRAVMQGFLKQLKEQVG